MTPTPSNTPTRTPQSTACPGLTPTRTPSGTPTNTPSITPTGTNPPPSPTSTPTKTLTPTPSPTFTCDCREWYVANENPFTIQITITPCDLSAPYQVNLGAGNDFTVCSCLEPSPSGGSAFIVDQGPCEITPTPTQTLTNTPTTTPTGTPSLVTPTPTPSRCFLTWQINDCAGTCSGSICACEGPNTILVYTECGVSDITEPDTQLYNSSSLISPYTGDFTLNPSTGVIYTSSGTDVAVVCNVGGPC